MQTIQRQACLLLSLSQICGGRVEVCPYSQPGGFRPVQVVEKAPVIIQCAALTPAPAADAENSEINAGLFQGSPVDGAVVEAYIHAHALGAKSVLIKIIDFIVDIFQPPEKGAILTEIGSAAVFIRLPAVRGEGLLNHFFRYGLHRCCLLICFHLIDDLPCIHHNGLLRQCLYSRSRRGSMHGGNLQNLGDQNHACKGERHKRQPEKKDLFMAR